MKSLLRHILLITLLLCATYSTKGQAVNLTFIVQDALTQSPVSGAICRLYWHGQSSASFQTTDDDGSIVISFEKEIPPTLLIEVAKAGYQQFRKSFLHTTLAEDTIVLKIEPIARLLPNYTLIADKRPYQEINNPAVNLIQRLIEVEQHYRQESPDFTFRKIDRLTIALANFKLESKWLNTLFPFFHRYVTTSKIDGRWVLPLSQREMISHIGYNATRDRFTEEIQYQTTKGIDEKIDDGTMTLRYEELFPKIDLFQNSIELLNNQFPSPLSPQGDNHYRYYLRDTLIQEGHVVHKVQFLPREPRAITFQGELTITAGKEPRLLTAVIQIPNVTNINFVDALIIRQHFGKINEKPHRHIVKEEELSLSLKMFWHILSLYVEQKRTYDLFNTTTPDTLLINAKELVTVKNSSDKEKRAYANLLREQELLASELGAEAFLEEIRQNNLYRILLDITEMVVTDYIRTKYKRDVPHGGSYFDIGPISSIIEKNITEGLRLKVGARTTAFLSRYLFLEGYAAYGFKDQKWKHRIEATYSFNPKKYYRHEFPRHEISVTKQFDLFTPGQVYTNKDKDNILFNIGIPYLSERTYRDLWKLSYQNDFSADFSLHLYAHLFKDYPTGTLSYVQVQKDKTMIQIPYITDAAVGIELRWSPGDRITQGSIQRHSIYHRIRNTIPIFRLKHETALQALGSDYSHNRTEISLEQRMWMSIFGRFDYQVTFGKIWNYVPFPMLYTPPTNSAFTLNERTYQLLRPLEFVADEWISIFTEYHLRGALMNHIPYINQLRLRGVLSLNYLYGNTSLQNRQGYSPELFLLPNISSEMLHDHYLEVGIGLENILQLLRIDLYRRITPLGVYSYNPWAIRGTIRLDF